MADENTGRKIDNLVSRTEQLMEDIEDVHEEVSKDPFGPDGTISSRLSEAIYNLDRGKQKLKNASSVIG